LGYRRTELKHAAMGGFSYKVNRNCLSSQSTSPSITRHKCDCFPKCQRSEPTISLASMQSLISNRPSLFLFALVLGVLTTLLYDYSASIGSRAEWYCFALALPFRLFTYALVLFSLPLLAERIADDPRRKAWLALFWFGGGAALALLIWWLIAQNPDLYISPAISRFSPETLAEFAPGWTIAEVALGRVGAESYTWVMAIFAEILALSVISAGTAFYLAFCAKSGFCWCTYFAPIVSFFMLNIYNLFAPWSFVWDFDFS